MYKWLKVNYNTSSLNIDTPDMRWSDCEYQLWTLWYVGCVVLWIMYIDSCIQPYRNQGQVIWELYMCVCICVCVVRVALRGSEWSVRGLWSGAAEICINVPIDPVYWQLSLLIKSRASIKKAAVPHCTLVRDHSQEFKCTVEYMQRGRDACTANIAGSAGSFRKFCSC